MKRIALLFLGLSIVLGLSCCGTSNDNKVLLYRNFPSNSWERFDFVKGDIEVKKATTYDLALKVSFAPTYAYNNISVVFTIFDSYNNPFRTKAYSFLLKEKDGSWKSTLVDGCYHFSFPINNELTINEPGVYRFQLENRMPITPLTGITEISIINDK